MLDTSISVKSLLKYAGITFAFLIILFSVFMIGRISVDGNAVASSPKVTQISGETKQVLKSEPTKVAETVEDTKEVTEEQDVEEDVTPYPTANLSSNTPKVKEVLVVEKVVDPGPQPQTTVETIPLPPACDNTVAGFDYAYRKVNVTVSDLERDIRDVNWATLNSVRVTVTNSETCTIINPTKIKLKLNPKGKGSQWWDDDVFLPDSYKRIFPGDTVSEVIPVHVSYSDIHTEKEFKLTVFDDYDIAVSTYKTLVSLP